MNLNDSGGGKPQFDPKKADIFNLFAKSKSGGSSKGVPKYLAKPMNSSIPKKSSNNLKGTIQETGDGAAAKPIQYGPFVPKEKSYPRKQNKNSGLNFNKDAFGNDTLTSKIFVDKNASPKKPANGTNSVQVIDGKEVLATYQDGQWFRASGPIAQPQKVHKGDIRYASNGQLERWDGNSWELADAKKSKKALESNKDPVDTYIVPKQPVSGSVNNENRINRQKDASASASLKGESTKSSNPKSFGAIYGDPETAQKALYASIDARMKEKPGTIREFGIRGTAGYYAEVETKEGWVSVNSAKALDKLSKYAPSKEVAASLPALVVAPVAATAVQTSPVEAGQITATQQAEKANFAAMAPKVSSDFDLGEAAKKSQAIIAAADMNSDGKLAKPESALYNPGDRNGNGKIGVKEANKFIKAADTNKSGVISAQESQAYAVLDTNDNGKLGKKEYAAYKEIDANGDGDITNEEAQLAYNAPINSKQDKRTRQLAKEFLEKNAGKSGAQTVDTQVAALAGVQAAVAQAPANPVPDVIMPAPEVINPIVAAPTVAFVAAADRNDNGVVGAGEQAKFEAIADVDASGEVTTAEAQAFALIDSNENGKIGKKELAAFRAIDKNGDGNLTTKEAKAALKAQIDNVQDKRTHDLAKDYLAKNPGNGGGSDEVDAAAAALVNAGRTESSLKKEAAAAKKSKK